MEAAREAEQLDDDDQGEDEAGHLAQQAAPDAEHENACRHGDEGQRSGARMGDEVRERVSRQEGTVPLLERHERQGREHQAPNGNDRHTPPPHIRAGLEESLDTERRQDRGRGRRHEREAHERRRSQQRHRRNQVMDELRPVHRETARECHAGEDHGRHERPAVARPTRASTSTLVPA